MKEAVRLGCAAIGYTIYPGSDARNAQYEDAPRADRGGQGARPGGGGLELPARRRASPRRARRRSTSPPTPPRSPPARRAHHQGEAAQGRWSSRPRPRRSTRSYQIPTTTLAERVRHVVQSAFNGKRIVIFSGGEAKGTEDVLAEIRGIADGGALRLDHGAQRLPAPAGRGAEAARRRHEDLRRPPSAERPRLGRAVRGSGVPIGAPLAFQGAGAIFSPCREPERVVLSCPYGRRGLQGFYLSLAVPAPAHRPRRWPRPSRRGNWTCGSTPRSSPPSPARSCRPSCRMGTSRSRPSASTTPRRTWSR